MEINSTSTNSITIDLLKLFSEGLNNHLFDSPQTCVEMEFDDARKTRRKLFETNKIPTKENSTRLYTIRLVHARKSDLIEVKKKTKKTFDFNIVFVFLSERFTGRQSINFYRFTNRQKFCR